MRPYKRFVFILLALFLSSAVAAAGPIGSPAPAFTLPDEGGRPVELERFRGRVVFLNFWASWCGPCKKELPEINAFIDRYGAGDAVVLAVNIDKKRSHADAFIERLPKLSKNLITLFDPEATVIPGYKARAMPTSFIIDTRGRIRYIHFGFNEADPEKWAGEIDALLAEARRSGGAP